MTTTLATYGLLAVHLWASERVQLCPTQVVCAASSLPCSVGSFSLLFITGGQRCAPRTFKSTLGLGGSLILMLGVTAVSSWETDNPGFGAPFLSGSSSRHPQCTRKGCVQASSHNQVHSQVRPKVSAAHDGPQPSEGSLTNPSNLPLPARTEACAWPRGALSPRGEGRRARAAPHLACWAGAAGAGEAWRCTRAFAALQLPHAP